VGGADERMIDAAGILNSLRSQCERLGVFDAVGTHEPKSAPAARTGVSAYMWVNDFRPVQSSGLASVSVRFEVCVCMYTSMLQEPQDSIDLTVLGAADTLLSAVINAFTFGGLIRTIDVFGSDGEGLRVLPGYVTQDSKTYRVLNLFIPMIVNDVYAEVP
jgi:hypothetical protein